MNDQKNEDSMTEIIDSVLRLKKAINKLSPLAGLIEIGISKQTKRNMDFIFNGATGFYIERKLPWSPIESIAGVKIIEVET